MPTDDPFTLATREAVKARIALTGPPGSGKTFTALTLATGLSGRVAVIDTERGRAKEYAGTFSFHHFAPVRFDPRELVRLLAVAGQHGYGAIVIDSLSHYWMGKGGALEFVDERKGFAGGGWKDFRPIENSLLDAILSYPGHVIVTMRVKTAYVVETGPKGKQVPRKIGQRPEQREGIEYEFSLVGEMDHEHSMTVTKSTCPALSDAVIERPGTGVAESLLAWIDSGVPLPDAKELRDQAIDPATTHAELGELFKEVRRRGLSGASVVDDHGDDVTLGDLIVRLGNERKAKPEGGAP
jgi:AAA domain-containing protein